MRLLELFYCPPEKKPTFSFDNINILANMSYMYNYREEYIHELLNGMLLQVPGGHGGPGGGGPFKLNIVDSIERIKEEFNFLQAQYHKYVFLLL